MSESHNYTINLESLIDLSAKLNEKQSEEEILSVAALSLMGKLKIFRAAVYLKDGANLKPIISKGKKASEFVKVFELPNFLDLESVSNPLQKAGFKYAIPIKHNSESLFVIALGAKADKSAMRMEEIHYASLVSYIAGNAIINARNVNSIINAANNLERRNQLLTAMFEMSRDFAENISQKDVLKLFTYRLLGQLALTKFSLYYLESNEHFSRLVDRFNHSFSSNALNKILNLNTAQPLKDCEICQEFDELKASGVAIVAPLIVHGRAKGVLLIGEKLSKEEFTEDNFLFVEALGNTAIAALENTRLFQDQLEKKKLESELNLALDIQKGLLPKSAPDIYGYDLQGLSYPSKHIGGDYYDFIQLDSGRTLIAIADVSGKGIPASLLMANVQAALRALSPLELPLKELVGRINSVVYQNTTADKFVTFFCGILNTLNGEFEYLNAGHNPPYLARANGDLEELTFGGLILGLFDSAPPYEEGKITINIGDALLLYTDGVTEAMNLNHEDLATIV